MALTTLDPRTALIVVDLQNGIVAYPTVPPVSDILGRARSLLDAFRGHGLPVALVNAAGIAPGRSDQGMRMGALPAGWTDFVPELGQAPTDHVVTKRTWGAFTATDLGAWLEDEGVTQVVVIGVATSIGVESTARQAHERGLNVTLATDAMTDMSPEAHANSIQRIFPRMAETGTTADIIALLETTRG